MEPHDDLFQQIRYNKRIGGDGVLFSQTQSQALLILSPPSMHSPLLKELSNQPALLDYQLMTMDGFREKLLFSYNEETVWYLMNEYHVSATTAKQYLDSLYLIALTDQRIAHPKIEFLMKIKSQLMANNKIKRDVLFTRALEKRQLIVFGYLKEDPWIQWVVKQIKQYSTYPVRYEAPTRYDKVKVYYAFTSLEEETHFVAQQIAEKLANGVSPERLHVMNIQSDYQEVLSSIFHFHGIAFDFMSKTNLLAIPKVQEFLHHAALALNLEVAWNTWNNGLSDDDKYSPWNQGLYHVLIRLNWFLGPVSTILPFLRTLLEQTKLPSPRRKGTIREMANGPYLWTPEDQIFWLGFNQGIIPSIQKNDQFLSDDLAQQLGLPTSEDWNRLNYQKTRFEYDWMPSVVISTKTRSAFRGYELSSFLLRENFVKKTLDPIPTKSYSKTYDLLRLAAKLDDYFLYYSDDPLRQKLYFTYPQIPYLTYDNQMTGISPSILARVLKNQLNLYPSGLETFFRCAFKFYVQDILNLKEQESTFDQLIGKLFHQVLQEDHYADLETYFDSLLAKEDYSAKELFFLNKLKKQLRLLVNYQHQIKDVTYFDDYKAELPISMDIDGPIKTHLSGRIDRLEFLARDGKIHLAIVDYKTGKSTVNLKYAEHGFGIQLPIYMYLLHHHPKFPSIEWAGFYLQPILQKELIHQDDTQPSKSNFRYEGFSTSNLTLLKDWDRSYPDSIKIKSLQITKSNKFNHHAKILTPDQFQTLIDQTGQLIKTAINQIGSGQMPVNPKVIENKNKGCEYCTYHDLCFVRNENEVIIKLSDDKKEEVEVET